MKRRTFLTIPFIASALMAEAQKANNSVKKKGLIVEKGRGRNIENLKVLGSTFYCKVSGKDTNGQFCIFDTIRDQGFGGPPLNLHHKQNECFYVIKGGL
jgi:hypothetical protein